MNTPVLFLIFNRSDTTSQVFEAIRAARPTRLYVAADGPRADRLNEFEACQETRRIATDVDWPCEVKTNFREKNLGCRRAVSGAISWFFEHEAEGIILEDDCLPDPSFFTYCATLLERYRDEPAVMCITGNNFQSSMGQWPYSYYFSIYNHIWGWASWRRAWANYDAEFSAFDPREAPKLLRKICNATKFADYWSQNFEKTKNNEIDTWDYAWTWSCWYNGGLTCTPRVNLVSNIGFGADATHTGDANSPLANLPTQPLHRPYLAPPDIEAVKTFDDHVTLALFKLGGKTFMRRAKQKIEELMHRTVVD